ncbi:MAG TPA: polysaccharide biosynthesis tyrosine autokinase [Verrucomicrobiae bacterium]|jgi:capsular exopolysaccharide synthesis family protein|nr:polysaccharide biosynthesis tyrosine autokinase [Verrucomicrobiae bacterium]
MDEQNRLQLYEPRQNALERVNHAAGAYPVEDREAVPDLLEYWRVIQKRYPTVLVALLVVFMIGLFATFRGKPVYEARALIEIQKENPDVPTLQELFQIEGVSDAYIETQNRILKSENLARRVITQLGLEKLPEFTRRSGSWQIAREKPAPEPVQAGFGMSLAEDKTVPEEVLKNFEERLTVEPVKRSRLIEVTFESNDPNTAAQVVNTLTSAYIDANLEARWQAAQKASDWLSQQLLGMKAKLEKSEDELQKYGRGNGLLFLETEKGTSENIVVQRLRELQQELTKAQADRYAKESLYKLLEERNYAELPGVFDNKLIQELTARLADLQREQSRLSANFNPNYPRVKELQSQIDESKAMLEAERARAAGGIANDYKAAVSHEEMLQKAFTEQERQANDIAGKSVQYNILKREADTNKQLYVGLLEKLKETGVSSSLKATNIRVVDPAYPPKKFARPRILLDLSITLIVGMCLGIAAAFLQEHLDNTLKSSEDIERFLQIPALGAVPAMELSANPRRLHGFQNNAAVLEAGKGDGTNGHNGSNGNNRSKNGTRLAPPWNRIEVQDGGGHPHGALAEAFHGLRTSVLLSTAKRPPATLLVTSAQQGEGKTTVAANLAASLAQLGDSVLLIDADLRRPSLQKFFQVSRSTGLVNYLTGDSDWRSLVWQAAPIGVSVLFCGPVPPNPADLLSSEYMRSLIREASKEYKFVVLDSPPLLNLSDSRILATLVDGVILVVGGGTTPRELVQRAYLSAVDAGSHVIGATINFADVRNDYYYSGYHQEAEESEK